MISDCPSSASNGQTLKRPKGNVHGTYYVIPWHSLFVPVPWNTESRASSPLVKLAGPRYSAIRTRRLTFNARRRIVTY